MNRQIANQTHQQKPTATPAASGLLQRTCACGNKTIAGGECEACGTKRINLQRRAVDNQSEHSAVPPIVHEVLRSRGQPLDPAIRAFMEPRFGHDFSGVQVHTDAKAAESAGAVNALAYTVGNQIAFGSGQYRPAVPAGRQLLAHELAHVVQQRGAPAAIQPQLTVVAVDTPTERAAEDAATAVLAGYRAPHQTPVAPRIARQEQEESSTGGMVTLRVQGDSERRSPPAGVPIQNGTLEWTLAYKGQAGSSSISGGQINIVLPKDVQMNVTFTPSVGAGGCPTITFIQIVRATTGGIPDSAHLLPIRESSGFAADVTRDESETEPYYGVGGQPGSAGTGLVPDMSSQVAGTAAGRSQSATFGDAPVRGAHLIPPGQSAVREFEVAVICVENGATFGSIRWGYTKTANGVITLTGGQVSDVQATAASPTVEAARQAFYAGFFQHTLPGFARGSAALTRAHRATLDQIAALGNVRRIILAGGNDFSGGPEANANLSLRRAEAARDYLMRRGVDTGLIQVQGLGVTARVTNRPATRMAANRRVDIHIDRGTDPRPANAQGSALEARRFQRQDPHHTYNELVDLLLALQSQRGEIPVSACNQLTHMVDGLDRARAQDPTVPDVHEIYGPLIRRLRPRCASLVPGERPRFDLPPLELPRLIDRIGEAVREEPF